MMIQKYWYPASLSNPKAFFLAFWSNYFHHYFNPFTSREMYIYTQTTFSMSGRKKDAIKSYVRDPAITLPTEMKACVQEKNMYRYLYDSIVHNNQKLDTIQMSTNSKT